MIQIREQDPLKQGLKLQLIESAILKREIREQDPLKQGLKPHRRKMIDFANDNSRARSIKTRIETPWRSV